jgi:hypothetical protein
MRLSVTVAERRTVVASSRLVPRHTVIRGVVAAACIAAGIGTSCSGDDRGQSTVVEDGARRSTSTLEQADSSSSAAVPTSTSTPTTQIPAPLTEADEVTARYVEYWDARFAANSGTPNPDDPALREFATGEQLEQVIEETQVNLDQGVAFRSASNPTGVQRVTVVELAGDRAVVQECVVADGVVIRRDSGEVINDEVATHNVRGELVRIDGVWRVASVRLVQRWEGVAGCALAS